MRQTDVRHVFGTCSSQVYIEICMEWLGVLFHCTLSMCILLKRKKEEAKQTNTAYWTVSYSRPKFTSKKPRRKKKGDRKNRESLSCCRRPARAGWSHDLHDTFAGRSWVTQCLIHYKYHCTEIWQARPLARDPSGPTRDRWTGSGRPIGQAWQAKAGRIRSDRAGTGGTISLLKLLTESSKPRLVRGCDLQTTNPMHLLSRSM